MVMTLHKITAGDGYLYLLKHTARGDGNGIANGPKTGGVTSKATAYYTARGNPPGQWTGRGAHLLNLDGKQVTEEQMKALFGLGAHPDADAMISAYLKEHGHGRMTDEQWDKVLDDAIRHATLGRQFPLFEQLDPYDDRVQARLDVIREQAGRDPTQAEISKVKGEEARRQRSAVAGFDLAFTPIKSASLLWAVDPRPEIREAIRTAHQRSVKDAMNLIEDHAAYTRTGTGGLAQIETKGLIAAQFEHWDSRAGDPNLHTHMAVSSKVQGTDGVWRSLDARTLYRLKVAASDCYNTAFEAHLTSLLGVTFSPRPGAPAGKEPVREIDGVPPEMVDHFSRRRAQIDHRYDELLAWYRKENGREPDTGTARKLADQATVETRPDKQPPRSLKEHQDAWRAELAEEFGPDALDQVTSAVPSVRPGAGTPAPVPLPDFHLLSERILASVASRRSTWTRWNVRAEAERVLRTDLPGLSPGDHAEFADLLTDLALCHPAQCDEWRRHVTVIAAYRDQHRVATDDPRQVLGPYPTSGHAGHKPYWQAAESVLQARRAAGLDHESPSRNSDVATAQIAADIYRSLPEPDRAEIAASVAERAGTLWLGDRSAPDEEAAAQPAYAGRLAETLTERGHLHPQTLGRDDVHAPADEPVEASYARRGRSTGAGRQQAARHAASVAAQRRGARVPLQPPEPIRPSGPVPRL